VTLPYTRQLLSDTVGCVSYQGIVMAEDEHGAPALYWPSARGMYRYGARGLQYISHDIEDLWETVNLSATYGITAAYHADAGQVWVFLPTADSNTPTVLVKFHVTLGRSNELGEVRGGWTRDDGNLATSTAVCMFQSGTFAGSGPNTTRLKPYVAKTASGGRVYRADDSSSELDDAAAASYTAYMITRAVQVGMGQEFGVQNVYVQTASGGGVLGDVVTVGLRRDFTDTDDVSALMTLDLNRRTTHSVAVELSECDAVQVRIAQSTANVYWQVDRIGLRLRLEAPKES
jgi:hypothetical protein